MKHSKQLITVLISLFIAFSPLAECSFSYADSNQQSWIYVSDQLSEANKTATVAILKAYLGARNFTMFYTYPVEKAIVSWDYAKWNEIAKIAGLSGLDDFNNRIAYAYNNNNKLKFYMDATGLSKANILYQAILEYYGVQANQNKNIYSGKWFQDDDGNGCYVFISSNSFNEKNLSTYNQYVSATGTFYRFNFSECEGIYSSLSNGSYNEYNITVNNQLLNTWYLYKFTEVNDYTGLILNNSNNKTDTSRTKAIKWNYVDTNNKLFSTINGFPCIIQSNNSLYIGNYRSIYYDENNTRYTLTFSNYGQLNTNAAVNAAISAAQGGMNSGIVAAGKAASITTGKEGLNAIKDYLEDNDSTDDDEVVPVDDPVTPPPIDDNPQNPTGTTDPNPHQPTNWTGLNQDSNGNFNFTMPNLNVNWNLDFGENPPFPFSIPFDLLHFLQAFNTEPVTPHIEETITICNMDLDIDIDLEWLDDVAGYFRTFILLSYIIGLIIATRALFHIY